MHCRSEMPPHGLASYVAPRHLVHSAQKHNRQRTILDYTRLITPVSSLTDSKCRQAVGLHGTTATSQLLSIGGVLQSAAFVVRVMWSVNVDTRYATDRRMLIAVHRATLCTARQSRCGVRLSVYHVRLLHGNG